MIEIDERRSWDASRNLLLIGPGGAGKSSLGIELGLLIERRPVDIDQEFVRRIGDIDAFIRDEGYQRYKSRNSRLAREITSESPSPILLVTSSGFLTPDNPEPALAGNRKLLASSYSICLLPSRDLEGAVRIIVERQLARRFARDPAREEALIRERYPIYALLGDMVVYSAAAAGAIARQVARRLSARA